MFLSHLFVAAFFIGVEAGALLEMCYVFTYIVNSHYITTSHHGIMLYHGKFLDLPTHCSTINYTKCSVTFYLY